MSSTNRGARRRDQDYYVTPQWAVSEFLNQLEEDHGTMSLAKAGDFHILDPCAGGDIEHEMSYPAVFEKDWGLHAVTMDIREDSRADFITNYITTDIEVKFDLVITNPPFYIATDIIDKGLEDCKPGGMVIALQRLNFYGTALRKPWFAKQMPSYTYVHSRRMSCDPTKKGRTDSIEYAHFIWIKDEYPEWSQLKIIK